jgi:serine carboxypeptidase-like clade 2
LVLLSVYADKAADFVEAFPRCEHLNNNFDTYSGFLEVDGGDRQLHYVFIESQDSPSTDPVLLWLNGGPGCSSMLGLMQELGPFMMSDNSTNIHENPFSWNKRANMIFLEAPAGVGFSVHETDYRWSDENTANDSYAALKEWFKRFPEFAGRDFYITGESYGGMYVPYLAQAIVHGNAASPADEHINIKGIAIGNGALVWDRVFRQKQMVKFMLDHEFTDPETARSIHDNCNLSLTAFKCTKAMSKYTSDIDRLNVYNVYGYCYDDSTPREFKEKNAFAHPYTPWLTTRFSDFADDKNAEDGDDTGADLAPCTDFWPVTQFFNDPYVQEKLHINGETQWKPCNTRIALTYHSGKGSYEVIPELHEAGLKIMLYSGNQDAAVSLVETQASIPMIEGV